MYFETPIEITPDWIEPAYGHVHHGRALSLLEKARVGLLASIGCPNDEMLQRGLALVITEVRVRYKRELKLGMVKVTCEDGKLEGREVVLQQRVINERGKVVMEAEVRSALMHTETRRGIPFPAFFIEKFTQWSQTSACP
jgi:YbgC/YbaW family acyl-CoA thioester hydrolase